MAAHSTNLVYVLSDEHCSKYLGCYGHPIVKTPNFDRFAKEGTRFTNAYTSSPICMPARASMMTGLYPHETGYWCNASPYDGRIESWAHRLRANEVPVTSVGKLHYRDDEVSSGFNRQIVPMHALNGVGDLLGALRERKPLPVRRGSVAVSAEIGPGESSYTAYDRDITERAIEWLEADARDQSEPWVLYVGFVAPHFPLIAPEEFFSLYPPEDMPMPKAYRPEDWPKHPWFDEFRKAYITDTFFDDEKRRIAISGYFGLCSFVDHNFGRILDCLDRTGLSENTRVIYASDHGDNLGVRGLWQKSNFYEESASVPLIMRGPGVPVDHTCSTPVSLIDLYPTILDAVGCDFEETGLNGRSLISTACEPDDGERTVFGEYHGAGAVSGAFMLRKGRYKYIHYTGYPAQLFDLDADPEEMNDLSGDAAHAEVLADFEVQLRATLDPEAVDLQAKQDQAALIERFGGEERVLNQGTIGATPPPGVEPVIY